MKSRIVNFIKHPLFSGSFLMIGGSMVVNILGYVYHLVVGRLLGPVEYGVLASIFSILYIVSVVPLSASIAVVKFIAACKTPKEVTRTFNGINSLVIRIALIISVVMLISSWSIARFLNISEITPMLLVSPIVFFSIITLTNQSTSQGLLKFMGVVGPNFTSSFLKFVFGIFFILIGLAVPGAMLGVVIGAAFAYLHSLIIVKKNLVPYKGEIDFDIKPFITYALPVLLQALAFTSLFTLDVILVKHFLPEFDAGLYAALSTSGKVIYFASNPIAGVMFPIVTKRFASGEKFGKIFLLTLLATIAISVGVDIVYFLFPKFAISLLFGPQYTAAAGSLILMGIFMTFYSVNFLLVNYFLALGKTKIVILPILAAVLQVFLIAVFWHGSIQQVLNVSISLMVILFVLISSILGYGEVKAKLASK